MASPSWKLEVPVFIVDVFAKSTFSGNPASVCFLQADAVSWMHDARYMSAWLFNLGNFANMCNDHAVCKMTTKYTGFPRHLTWKYKISFSFSTKLKHDSIYEINQEKGQNFFVITFWVFQDLSDATKQRVAAEMNQTDTAFVSRRTETPNAFATGPRSVISIRLILSSLFRRKFISIFVSATISTQNLFLLWQTMNSTCVGSPRRWSWVSAGTHLWAPLPSSSKFTVMI